MSRNGLTLEQTKALARERGFLTAYMPDHASKSRFTIPGQNGFTSEDANWISGGQLLGGLTDRVLAGFNRLMAQGVEPLARLIWAPQLRSTPGQKVQRPPLREPVITADPQAVQQRQVRDLAAPLNVAPPPPVSAPPPCPDRSRWLSPPPPGPAPHPPG